LNDACINRAIIRLKRRDIGGLEILVRRYQVRAVRAAYLITGDQSEAEDIVQMAFLQVSAKINQYDEGRPFEPWFMRIVANYALQAARKSYRYMSLDAPLSTDPAQTFADLIADDGLLPSEIHEQDELRTVIRAALDALPPDQRAAVVMRYYLDMSEQQMMESASVPRGTIKWRLHEARRHLRMLLPAHLDPTIVQEEDTAHE
jgi:RNA polymerase sigma-70 factor (ECF subfamily)